MRLIPDIPTANGWEVRAGMRPTCVGNGGVLVQGHQGRIQQDDVGVLGDHPVVRGLDPRLVLVHCGGDREEARLATIHANLPPEKETVELRVRLHPIIEPTLNKR